MDCPSCSSPGAPQGARFCPFCASPLPSTVAGPTARAPSMQVTPTEFVDIQIRAWLHDARHVHVLVHNSPAGDMRRPVAVRADLALLRNLRDRLDSAARRREPSRSPLTRSAQAAGWLYQAGRALSGVLLPPPVFALLLQSLDRVEPACLRVRLCLDGSLVDLPWEYLYRPDLPGVDALPGFLALNPRLSLVREPPSVGAPVHRQPDRQRLVFAGAPFVVRGKDLWGVGDELRALIRALDGVADLLPVEHTNPAGDSFGAVFRRPVSIFHYAGYTGIDGDRGFLVLDLRTRPDPAGNDLIWEHPAYRRTYGTDRLYVTTLSGELLAPLLYRAGVRLALFCAGSSGRWPYVRSFLRQGLPAVIGTQGQVSTQGAAAFFEKLYTSLALGLSLDEAVTWARLHVLERALDSGTAGESHEWGVFMVYMRCADASLLARPEGRQPLERQADARWRRQQTIYNVTQIIGTVAGGSVEGARLNT